MDPRIRGDDGIREDDDLEAMLLVLEPLDAFIMAMTR